MIDQPSEQATDEEKEFNRAYYYYFLAEEESRGKMIGGLVGTVIGVGTTLATIFLSDVPEATTQTKVIATIIGGGIVGYAGQMLGGTIYRQRAYRDSKEYRNNFKRDYKENI